MAEPHVVSALKAKRAELAGEIELATRRLQGLRAALEHLDATRCACFEPAAVLEAIEPKVWRPNVKEAVGKVVGDAKLQAEGKADQAEGKLQNVVGSLRDMQRRPAPAEENPAGGVLTPGQPPVATRPPAIPRQRRRRRPTNRPRR